MRIEDVKKNLNKEVLYGKGNGSYKLTACVIRKNEDGFLYQAELLDERCGNSVIICKL